MKIFKIYLVNFVLASTLWMNARANDIKQPVDSINTTSIILTGQISDLKSTLNLLGESSIHIYVSNLPFIYLEMIRTPHREFVIKYKEGETFLLKIPTVDKINYVRIAYTTPSNKPIADSVAWIDNYYIIKPGDSIFCKLNASSRKFSGRGAERFNLQQRLYESRYIAPPSLNQKIRDKSTIIQGLDERDFKCDSVYKIQKQIIKRYKDSLDQSTLKIITANSIGTRYYGLLRTLGTLKEQYPIIVGSNFFKKIGTQAEGIESADLLQSPVYYNIIIQKLRLEATLNVITEDKTIQARRLFYETYKLISERYAGNVKDKLLALLVLVTYNQGYDALAFLIDKIEDPKYKEPLTVLMNLKKKGRDFSKYKVTNQEGRTVSLSKFNEKVVILDFWYTGCIACIKLNQSLYPVYETFKNNPNVKFVSVSIDRTMDIWNRGLNSGKYTHEASVNLYTGGLENYHPIIKENMILSYPQFYILKNGLIWDATPPKPRGPKDLATIKELSKMIETAIKK